MALAEARALTMQRALHEKEPRCPCCGQMAKVYRRTINAGMAQSLIAMWRAAGTDWQYVPETVGARSREEGKLVWWSFVEPKPGAREDGSRHTGWWRLTEDGAEFALQRARTQKYAIVYANRCLALEGHYVDIVDCLGEKFDYRRLLAGE